MGVGAQGGSVHIEQEFPRPPLKQLDLQQGATPQIAQVSITVVEETVHHRLLSSLMNHTAIQLFPCETILTGERLQRDRHTLNLVKSGGEDVMSFRNPVNSFSDKGRADVSLDPQCGPAYTLGTILY